MRFFTGLLVEVEVGTGSFVPTGERFGPPRERRRARLCKNVARSATFRAARHPGLPSPSRARFDSCIRWVHNFLRSLRGILDPRGVLDLLYPKSARPIAFGLSIYDPFSLGRSLFTNSTTIAIVCRTAEGMARRGDGSDRGALLRTAAALRPPAAVRPRVELHSSAGFRV